MLETLLQYKPDEAEKFFCEDILSLIKNFPDCYHRDHFNPGHVTGSGLLISADGKKVLMNHHKFLNMWICFGGHADGNQDILDVARREVIEESGIHQIQTAYPGIFSLDVHDIPENPHKNEPKHKHFDIRYMFRVTHSDFENFTCSDESKSLRWCSFEEAKTLASSHDESMHRLLDKWKIHEKF